MALAPAPHLEREENSFFRGKQSHMKGMDETTKKKRATKGKGGMMVRNNNSDGETTLYLVKRFGSYPEGNTC